MSEKKPRYLEVVNYIYSELEKGNLKEGDRLPSEKELCDRFGLSRQTIRHATGLLEERGLITRVRGSGSYIEETASSEDRPRYMNIAVMMTYLDNYIFPPVVRGISDVLSRSGYSMQLNFTNKCVEREENILQNLLSNQNIDALIAEPSQGALPNPNRELFLELKERRIPVLFINAYYPDLDFPCVRLDDEWIACQAVHLLVQKGHEKIAGIFHCEDSQGTLRYLGYRRGLQECGIRLNSDRVIWLDTKGVQDIEELTAYIRKRIGDCTAVFTYNDEVASRLIAGCEKAGLHLPEDLSIISVDDAKMDAESRPSVTTFPHPKEVLGKTAAENILHMIDNPAFDGNRLFRPEVILRDSVLDRTNEE
ncbi:GntR family transcriptional regulator [Lachnospiraceae bacterium YH-ros2228]